MSSRSLTHWTTLCLAHWRRIIRILFIINGYDLLNLRVKIVIMRILMMLLQVFGKEGLVTCL